MSSLKKNQSATCTVNALPLAVGHQPATTTGPVEHMHHGGGWYTGYACFIGVVVLFILLFIFWFLIFDCWKPKWCCKKDKEDEKDCCRVLWAAFIVAILTLFIFWLIWWACASGRSY